MFLSHYETVHWAATPPNLSINSLGPARERTWLVLGIWGKEKTHGTHSWLSKLLTFSNNSGFKVYRKTCSITWRFLEDPRSIRLHFYKLKFGSLTKYTCDAPSLPEEHSLKQKKEHPFIGPLSCNM